MGGIDTNGYVNQQTGSPNGLLPNQQSAQPDYEVVSGDTLYAISQRTGIPLEQLIAANPHIDNPHWIYPGDPIFFPEGGGSGETGGTDGTGGTGETGGTGGTDETGEAGESEQPGSNSPEAQAVNQAKEDYDNAVARYNAVPTQENLDAIATAQEELNAAVQAEIEADVAALNPPPATYEEYQQAVRDSAARVAARYPDDTVMQTGVQQAQSELTSVEYLEAYQAQAHADSAEADRRQALVDGANEVHGTTEAQATQQAAQEVADAQENLETQRSEGTPNEIKEAEERLAEAQKGLEQAIAAEINARIEAAGATDPEEIAQIEAQVRQDVLDRVPPEQRASVESSFEAASESASITRTTDEAAEEYDSAASSYESRYGEGNLNSGHTAALERRENAEVALEQAVRAEIEAGLEDFRAENPDATEDDIQAEAERLGEAIVSRTGNSEYVSEVVGTVVDDYN